MEIVDRQEQVYAEWDRKARQRIRALITPELIEEHARAPLGEHSDALQRVLAYFRRQPLAGKHVIVAVERWREYRIAKLTGVRGLRPVLIDGETFATEEAAMHAVFLRRVRDLEED